MSANAVLFVMMLSLLSCGRQGSPPPASGSRPTSPGSGAEGAAGDAVPFTLDAGLAVLAPPGYAAAELVRVDSGDRLFEHIGILASFVNPRGHRSSVCQRFTKPGDDDADFGVCVHVMQDPHAAMAIYLRLKGLLPELVQRPDLRFALEAPMSDAIPTEFRHLKRLIPSKASTLDALPSPLGEPAWETATALFLVQGDAYMECFSERNDEGATQTRRRFMGALRQRYGGVTVEIPRFPKPGLVPGGVQIATRNGFGMSELDKLFTAEYQRGDAEAMAFWSSRSSAAEAAELAGKWKKLLEAQGAAPGSWSHPGATVLEVFGFTELVCVRGKVLAGVHQASSTALARDLAPDLCPAETGRP